MADDNTQVVDLPGGVQRVQFTSKPVAAEPAAAPASADRPSWLPENFKSPEDLVASYKALQAERTKGSQEKKPEEAAAADPAAAPAADPAKAPEQKPNESAKAQFDAATAVLKNAGIEMEPLSAEFAKDGKLSDASYAALAAKGFTKELVDATIRGMQSSQVVEQAEADALAAADMKAVKALAGGDEGYATLTKWAAANLSKEEIADYDAVMNGGDVRAIKFAVQALKARNEAETGKEPEELAGGSKPGEDVYRSMAEMKRDMAKPEYKTDPAFRAQVDAKLRRSAI